MGIAENRKECPRCGGVIDGADRCCRYCGHDQSVRVAWYYHPFWIAVLTVLALGPFSLYLVWRSPKLGLTGRWIATVLVLAFTVYLGFATVKAYRSLQEILGMPG